MSGKSRNPQRYKFRIRGRVDGLTRSALPDMQAETYGTDTILTGHLPDSAALYGVVAQLERLGLELLEIRQE